MTDLKPCPFCGETPELCCNDTMVKHKECFKHILFTIDEWNTRVGEPRRICGNCKHCKPVWIDDIISYEALECIRGGEIFGLKANGCKHWEGD